MADFYGQPINDEIKKYDEIRKVATGKGADYINECLLHYQYFKNHYKLIAVDLSKQKELDADPRTTQQIEFYGKLMLIHTCVQSLKNQEKLY